MCQFLFAQQAVGLMKYEVESLLNLACLYGEDLFVPFFRQPRYQRSYNSDNNQDLNYRDSRNGVLALRRFRGIRIVIRSFVWIHSPYVAIGSWPTERFRSLSPRSERFHLNGTRSRAWVQRLVIWRFDRHEHSL